jgi:hypothetical protein
MLCYAEEFWQEVGKAFSNDPSLLSSSDLKYASCALSTGSKATAIHDESSLTVHPEWRLVAHYVVLALCDDDEGGKRLG